MTDENLLKKQLCDHAIIAGGLDVFFHDILFYTTTHIFAQDTQTSQQTFFELASLILKERYHLFIDEYPDKPIDTLPVVSDQVIDDMDSIDLFFEKYYNLLKARYTNHDDSLTSFFKDYHRRDLKQDSMLRAFIIVRNRLTQPHDKSPIGFGIAYLSNGLTGNETCKACFKSFFTVEGIRKYAGFTAVEREVMLKDNLKQYAGTMFPAQFPSNLCLESVAATMPLSLTMIEINKTDFRLPSARYFSQVNCFLG